MTTLLEELDSECNQCGRCCRLLGGSLGGSERDLARWLDGGEAGARVLEWVTVRRRDGKVTSVELWRDPKTGAEWSYPSCPWLVSLRDGGDACGIYELRPDVCRDFPSFTEQVESMCIPGGLEVDFETDWRR